MLHLKSQVSMREAPQFFLIHQQDPIPIWNSSAASSITILSASSLSLAKLKTTCRSRAGNQANQSVFCPKLDRAKMITAIYTAHLCEGETIVRVCQCTTAARSSHKTMSIVFSLSSPGSRWIPTGWFLLRLQTSTNRAPSSLSDHKATICLSTAITKRTCVLKMRLRAAQSCRKKSNRLAANRFLTLNRK